MCTFSNEHKRFARYSKKKLEILFIDLLFVISYMFLSYYCLLFNFVLSVISQPFFLSIAKRCIEEVVLSLFFFFLLCLFFYKVLTVLTIQITARPIYCRNLEKNDDKVIINVMLLPMQ